MAIILTEPLIIFENEFLRPDDQDVCKIIMFYVDTYVHTKKICPYHFYVLQGPQFSFISASS